MISISSHVLAVYLTVESIRTFVSGDVCAWLGVIALILMGLVLIGIPFVVIRAIVQLAS
jgi:hypothetical protein